MPAPIATFAIPCRDAGPHLRPMLESLLRQTRQDFGLLLVDDDSGDDSVAIARAIAGGRLLVHRNEPALGIGGNWNRCVELAATEFVCLAHQDDVYEPRYLERMVDALTRRTDAGMAHCRATTIDGDGAVVTSPAENFKAHFWKHTPGEDRAAHYRRLWRGNFVVCPSILHRTAALRATGPFRTDLRFALDWEYSFRMLRAGFGIVDVPEALMHYRRHAAAATATANNEHRFEEELAVLREAAASGHAMGFLSSPTLVSPALRNNLLHEALADLEAGRRDAVATKLEFVRTHAPELWRDRYVRVFRGLWRCGGAGRWALGVGRRLAVQLGLGGVAG